MEKVVVSVISTLSYLQSVGICHRDIKPANMFLHPTSSEMKIIDFGESKDHFKDGDDGGAGTMATIRGTPQYLSPTLWKAHVEGDGNTRHTTHSIYKSDVFSAGLIFFQMCSMEDVTGFNQKNQVNDGEGIIEKGLQALRSRYSEHVLEIIRLTLKFDEGERPSFIELGKLVLTSTENTIESPKGEGSNRVTGGQRKSSMGGSLHKPDTGRKGVSKTFSMQKLKDSAAEDVRSAKIIGA